MSKKSSKNKRIGDKIRFLRHESVPEKQAVAEALSMERSGRLKSGGRYTRKGRKGSKRA